MAINSLPGDVRPANPATRMSPGLSRAVCRAVDNARLHLRSGNAGAYARSIAGEHRAQNARQQRALEAVIVADATSRLFTRHPGNGCLMAKEA